MQANNLRNSSSSSSRRRKERTAGGGHWLIRDLTFGGDSAVEMLCGWVSEGKELRNRRRTARRAVSVTILSTVHTSWTTNPQQIAVTELDYCRVTVERLVVNSHDSSTVV